MKKLSAYIRLIVLVAIAVAIVIFGKQVVDLVPSASSGESLDFSDVYPDGKTFDTYDLKSEDGSINNTYKVLDQSGKEIGFVFDTTTTKGYGGDINFLIGISNDGEIKGFKPVSHKETDGFGSKMSESSFLEGIKGSNVSKGISYGSGNKENGEIIAISGATITTDAIVNQIKLVLKALSTVSENISVTEEKAPYFAEKYEELFENEISTLAFEEFTLDGFYNDNVQRILRVKDENRNFNSYIIQLAEKGFGGTINTLVRVTSDFRVYNIAFGSHSETPNYGEYIEHKLYKKQMVGLNLEKNFLTKSIKLKENPTGEKDILMISGATVTSKAMQSALNASIEKLVEFKKVKDVDSNYQLLTNEELFASSNTAKAYPHLELIAGVESTEIIDGKVNEEVVATSKAVLNGEEVYIFDVNVKGFAGIIEYGLVTSLEGGVKDFVVYASNETEDYGGVITGNKYKEKMLTVDLSKLDSVKAGDDIQAISGATITTDAMIKSMNSILEIFKSLGQ